MDISFNGKAWVGNFCQKFEAICQQVDGFVSQAVGGEKNLPSNVEQDLVPPKVDPVKHEDQTAPQEPMDTIICNEGKAVEIDIKQSSMEQEHNDPLENCHVKTEDSPKDADKDVDALIDKNNQDTGVESNVNLEIFVEEIASTEEQTSLDLSYSEDKNLSEKSVFSEPSDSNFPQKEEEICCDPVDLIDRVSESCSTLDGDEKDVKMGLALSTSALSLESNDTESGRTDEAVSLAGSPRHEDELSWKSTQFEDFISPPEIGQVDGSGIDSEDGSMESIDLSDDENLDESCVVVDSRPVYSFSSRPRKFRSYKKIIQDAFNSRKRLVKEYEQLEVLYGNIDEDPNEIKTLLSNATRPSSSFKAKKSANEDPEWELV